MHEVLLAVASALQLASAEPAVPAAPIPLSGPITISQSGNYIVTGDFFGSPAIQFSGSATVTAAIDFDGHKVEGSIILRQNGEPGSRTLTIKNGEFVGSISATNSHGVGGWATIAMDSMTLNASANLEDASIIATHCRFLSGSLTTYGNFGKPLLHLEDSEVLNGSINGRGSRAHIVGNDIRNGSILMPSTVDGFSASGVIAGNVVHNGDIVIGRSPYRSSGVQLLHNDVSGYIRLAETHDSIVYGNVIRGCFTNGSALTFDDFSRRNQIVRNEFLGGCDHGIYFGNIAWDNVYLDNDFLVPVPQPIVDFGERNHSAPSVAVGPE